MVIHRSGGCGWFRHGARLSYALVRSRIGFELARSRTAKTPVEVRAQRASKPARAEPDFGLSVISTGLRRVELGRSAAGSWVVKCGRRRRGQCGARVRCRPHLHGIPMPVFIME